MQLTLQAFGTSTCTVWGPEDPPVRAPRRREDPSVEGIRLARDGVNKPFSSSSGEPTSTGKPSSARRTSSSHRSRAAGASCRGSGTNGATAGADAPRRRGTPGVHDAMEVPERVPSHGQNQPSRPEASEPSTCAIRRPATSARRVGVRLAKQSTPTGARPQAVGTERASEQRADHGSHSIGRQERIPLKRQPCVEAPGER